MPLSEDTLAASSITIVPVVRTRSGSTMALNAITVPTGILLKDLHMRSLAIQDKI